MKIKNIKKIFKLSILLILLNLILVNCSKLDLNINKDPNAVLANDATPFIIFPSATMSLVTVVGGNLSLYGGLLSQFWTQSHLANQFRDVVDFNINSNSSTPGLYVYRELYAGALKDLQTIIDYCKANNDYKYYKQSVYLKAYTYQLLTDLYSKIPYKNALSGETNLIPTFDEGKDISLDLIKSIDNALNLNHNLVTYTTNEKNADLIFAGDTSSWRRFANTLKLKIYLRLINVDNATANAGINGIKNEQFLYANAGVSSFINSPNFSNPLYEFIVRRLNVATNLQPCYSLTSWLDLNSDTRKAALYSGATTLHFGDYNAKLTGGLVYGTAGSTGVSSILTATDPVYLFTSAETGFLKAEAAQRYNITFADGQTPKQLYDSSVIKTYVQWGRPTTEASTAITAGGKYIYPSTLDSQLRSIIMQKRISLYKVNSIESFFDRNRTGYPEISSVYSASSETAINTSYAPGQLVYPPNNRQSGYMVRFPYPQAEINANSNVPTGAGNTIIDKVWWAK